MVFVTVTDDLVGKTQGLCGTYDGDQSNDFTTDTGTVVAEPASFVTTWKRTFAGGEKMPRKNWVNFQLFYVYSKSLNMKGWERVG